MRKSEYKKYFLYVLFGIYIAIVVWITIINRENGDNRATLTPFWEYMMVIKNQWRMNYTWQIVGNIALFIPLGFMFPFLPKFHSIKCAKVLLFGLCLSVFIELTQYVTGRGMSEFDDVFNNTFGTVIGYSLYKLFKRLFQR